MRPRRPPTKSGHPKRRFVKIILPSAIHGKQTRIPEEFIRSFGDELSDCARIRVPDGLSWKMGILKKGGEDVWFSSNWDQFAQYYSITYGSVLTFKYKGGSEFDVRIHDTSATEISYPSPRKRKRKSLGVVEMTDDGPRNKNQRSSPSNRHCSGRPKGEPATKHNRNRSGRPKREPATKHNPKYPYFQRTIKNCNVYVPAEFAVKHLKLNESIKLQNWKGETWDAACSSHCGRSAAMRIGKGWIRFSRDNRVSPGDFCVFHLIKQRPVVVLKVEIIKP